MTQAAAVPASGRDARRAAVTDAVAAGDARAVADAVHALLGDEAAAADASFVERALRRAGDASGLRTVRTTIVRSVTVEAMVPFLAARAATLGLRLDVAVGGYGSWAAELLGDELAARAPQLLVVALELADLAGDDLAARFGRLAPADVATAVEEAAGRLDGLLRAARRTVPGVRIAVLGFAAPAWPALGAVADAQRGADSERAALQALNARLAAVAAALGDAVLVDVDALAAQRGRAAFRDQRMWHMAKIPVAAPHHDAWARWVARHLRPLFLPPKKVLVLDLDNTIWGGIVGDDGPDGVKTGADFPGSCWLQLQREARQLADRGVVLALASKNEPKAVEDAFALRARDMALSLTDFAAVRIGWEPKPQMIREIADELSLGLDSFVFVDDSPHECAAVRAALPQVEVIQTPHEPARLPGLLAGIASFEQLRITADDTRRGEMYRAERERKVRQSQAGSLEEFLRSLGIVVTLLSLEEAGVARVAQLLQKTNQFNVTTRRHGEDALRRLGTPPDGDVFAIRVRDSLGDAGVVGVVIARYAGAVASVDSFLLSCRVIGRGVEGALLAELGRRARAHGCATLVGEFIPTERNAPARDLFPKHGFAVQDDLGGGHVRYVYDLSAGGPAVPDWIVLEGPDR